MKHWLRHPSLALAISAALALASGTAAALGLGQIEVRSRAGQPLLAEIPVISTTPGEIEQLQARLASPETFARVGLQPPQGLVTDLRFSVAYDRSGRPVIRVTTDRPVEQPLLTFLVEVDWGQGRLVREYSALVDAPQAVSATSQPPIQAPAGAPSNVVARPADASQPPAPQRPAAESRPDRAGAGAAAAGEYGPVGRGESLSLIAARLGFGEGRTLDQAMIAMLRANPDAFIEGDINRLRQGAVLRVPGSDEMAAVDATQASQMVRERMRQWREARRQAVIAAEAPQAAPADTGAKSPASREPRASVAAPANARTPPTPGARLEIVPPTAGKATRAGTQSGIEAGGEGQMLRQELQQTQETLAARDAELQELKSRIAELEKLQANQQALIALKNSELAAAQQRLGTTAEAGATPPATADAPARDSMLPWTLGGAALLALLFGGWWMRRRSSARSPFRAPAHSAAADLAAAFPSKRGAPSDEDLLVVHPQAAEGGAAAPIASSQVDDASPDADDFASQVERAAALPTGHAEPFAAAASETRPSGAHVPTWHGASPAMPSPVAPLPLVEPASERIDPPLRETHEAEAPTNERLELAQAYLDLGDYDSARQLLGEVVVTGDHASSQRARRMLREIE